MHLFHSHGSTTIPDSPGWYFEPVFAYGLHMRAIGHLHHFSIP
jgi:hypothetical protein